MPMRRFITVGVFMYTVFAPRGFVGKGRGTTDAAAQKPRGVSI